MTEEDGTPTAATGETARCPRTFPAAWAVAGLGLIACMLVVSLLSPRYDYGGDQVARPTLWLVGTLISAGAFYLLAVASARRVPETFNALAWATAVGVVLRAFFLFSTPICETDFYRYLWDGAVVAHGHNPYSHAPEAIREAEPGTALHDQFGELAAASGQVIERVNHPTLATIYPPVAQAVFALTHWVRPWNLVALRLVLLGFDVITLLLVVFVLRRLKLPLLFLVVYWWNPMLIKETANSAHMDVIVLPFVIGALALSTCRRYVSAGAVLALAVGVKLWPVVLLPVVLRPVLSSPRRLVAAVLVFGTIAAVCAIPVVGGIRAGENSGFIAYGKTWEMNDSIHTAVRGACRAIPTALGFSPTHAQARFTARCIVSALLVAATLIIVRRYPGNAREQFAQASFVVAALFLLSPTQYPWYYIWLIPLLAFRPQPSLLLLTALLPLYYLRFHFRARNNIAVFDNGVVWIEFAPVWCLLVVEWFRARRAAVREAA